MTVELQKIIQELYKLLEKKCNSHGIKHALAVLQHVRLALEEEKEMDDNLRIAIELAALLHDADDRKFFNSVDNENAKHLMRNVPGDIRIKALEMIDLVSCSKNKNSVVKNEYYLFPRYADRLEAIGKIGVWRCFKYCNTINTPLYTKDTKRYTNLEELKETKQRFGVYKGNSDSMMDHFYDKLLHLADFETENQYFDLEKNERMQPIINTIMLFGKQGFITPDQITQLCSEE